MIAKDIVWETDGESIEDLPSEVEFKEFVDEEAIADHLSDMYGWLVKSFRVEETVNLGRFHVDVTLRENGKFNFRIVHDGGPSGYANTNVTADRIGDAVAEEIASLAEGYQQEFQQNPGEESPASVGRGRNHLHTDENI